jgi:hypothetical protein
VITPLRLKPGPATSVAPQTQRDNARRLQSQVLCRHPPRPPGVGSIVVPKGWRDHLTADLINFRLTVRPEPIGSQLMASDAEVVYHA